MDLVDRLDSTGLSFDSRDTLAKNSINKMFIVMHWKQIQNDRAQSTTRDEFIAAN